MRVYQIKLETDADILELLQLFKELEIRKLEVVEIDG